MNSISQTTLKLDTTREDKDIYKTINQMIAVCVLMRCEAEVTINNLTLFINPTSDINQCVETYKKMIE